MVRVRFSFTFNHTQKIHFNHTQLKIDKDFENYICRHLLNITNDLILRAHSDRMRCDFFAANNRIESYACVRN